MISTGCVGYVTERTFSQVVEAASASGGAPVVASFVLRMFPYDGVARSLKKRGWSTQKWPGSFRQRRFKDDGERRSVLAELERRGLEPGEREARDGYLHAELFVSCPTRFRFGQREAGEAAASA